MTLQIHEPGKGDPITAEWARAVTRAANASSVPPGDPSTASTPSGLLPMRRSREEPLGRFQYPFEVRVVSRGSTFDIIVWATPSAVHAVPALDPDSFRIINKAYPTNGEATSWRYVAEGCASPGDGSALRVFLRWNIEKGYAWFVAELNGTDLPTVVSGTSFSPTKEDAYGEVIIFAANPNTWQERIAFCLPWQRALEVDTVDPHGISVKVTGIRAPETNTKGGIAGSIQYSAKAAGGLRAMTPEDADVATSLKLPQISIAGWYDGHYAHSIDEIASTFGVDVEDTYEEYEEVGDYGKEALVGQRDSSTSLTSPSTRTRYITYFSTAHIGRVILNKAMKCATKLFDRLIKEALQPIETKLTDLESSINDLQTRADKIEESVGELASRVTKLESNV